MEDQRRSITQTTMDIVHVIQQIESAFAIILNLLLLVVILTRSGKHIGNYKYLLFFYTLVQLCSSICVQLVLPGYVVSTNGILLYATVNYLSRSAQIVAIFGLTVCILLLSFVLALSFLYRYFVFCRPEKLKWFEERKHLSLILLIVFLVAVVYEGSAYYYFRPSPELNILLAIPGMNMSSIGYMAVNILNSEGDLQYPAFFTIITWTGTVILCVIGVIYATVSMINAFQQVFVVASMSSQLVKVQRRLFMLLVLQTATPCIFNFFPIIFIYVLPYFSVQITIFRDITPMLIPMAQVIDPFLIFFFIPNYYKCIIECLNLLFCNSFNCVDKDSSVINDIERTFM